MLGPHPAPPQHALHTVRALRARGPVLDADLGTRGVGSSSSPCKEVSELNRIIVPNDCQNCYYIIYILEVYCNIYIYILLRIVHGI